MNKIIWAGQVFYLLAFNVQHLLLQSCLGHFYRLQPLPGRDIGKETGRWASRWTGRGTRRWIGRSTRREVDGWIEGQGERQVDEQGKRQVDGQIERPGGRQVDGQGERLLKNCQEVKWLTSHVHTAFLCS